MTTPKTIRVIAAKGRRVPIHPSVQTAPGNTMMYVTDDKPVELPDVSYVRRRMRAGDLELAPVAKPAAAPPAPAPIAVPPASAAPTAPETPKKEP